MAQEIKYSQSIEWRPIDEYFIGRYDWVLVRMYDGNYPCIPCVAEYREFDHQWHMNDSAYSVLPFPVLEFADMQLIPSRPIACHNHKYDLTITRRQLDDEHVVMSETMMEKLHHME